MASPTSILPPGDRTPDREPRLPGSKSPLPMGRVAGGADPLSGGRSRSLPVCQVRGGG